MLEKLYELWSIEKRVSVTIKSVGFLCMLPYKYEHHCTLKEFPVPEHQENFRLWPAPWLILYNIRKSC